MDVSVFIMGNVSTKKLFTAVASILAVTVRNSEESRSTNYNIAVMNGANVFEHITGRNMQ